MQSKTKVQGDVYISFEGGVDSNLRPRLLQPNQLAWAANCSVRGGNVSPRPGFLKRVLTYKSASDQTNLQDASTRFQGAGYYRAPDGTGEILVAVGGRVFSINPESGNQVSEVTTDDTRGSKNLDLVQFEQAEDWMIIQDGQSAPLIYNRSGSRRSESLADEIPPGSVGTYGNGRYWVGRFSEYAAGDLVGSSSGDPLLNRRDAVLKFTENDYLNEGGAFGTPANAGSITAMQVMGALDTATGDGDLIVFTESSAFATTVPTDRTLWKDLQYPVQRLVAPTGAVGPFSPINVNGDLYYRSKDGLRSLIFARRDYASPGTVPMSNEIQRVLDYDTERLLKHSSTAEYDNRLLFTCANKKTSRGVVHRALACLDFNPVSSTRVKAPLAYDGIWTGLDMLHVVAGEFGGVRKCFILSLNSSSEIELWEIEKHTTTDYDGSSNTAIEWFFETRAITFDSMFEKKRLDRFEVWLREVREQVDFTLYARPDESHVWQSWASWQENAHTEFCEADFINKEDVSSPRPSYRPRRGQGNPPETAEALAPDKRVNEGYSFQFRLAGIGYAKVDSIRVFAGSISEAIYPDPPQSTETTETGCPLEEFPQI